MSVQYQAHGLHGVDGPKRVEPEALGVQNSLGPDARQEFASKPVGRRGQPQHNPIVQPERCHQEVEHSTALASGATAQQHALHKRNCGPRTTDVPRHLFQEHGRQ